MSGSLQDQLLGLGVANKKQAQEAKTQKRKKTKQKKNKPAAASQDQAGQQQAQTALHEKAERDKQLNLAREQQKAKRAQEAEIKQLIESNWVEIPKSAETPYNFVFEKKIKTLYITPELQEQLTRGKLSIATYQESFRLVPQGVGARITERDPARVIFIEQTPEPDLDDPYADYQIPDDLMW